MRSIGMRLGGLLVSAAVIASCARATAEPPPPIEALPVCERIAALGDAWTVVGRSVQGRAIVGRRLQADGPRVLWVGGIHGDEMEGRLVTDGLFAALGAVAGSSPVDVVQVRVLNPDGVVRRSRVNVRGVDLNRNFPTADFGTTSTGVHGAAPLSEPESRLLHEVVLAYRPDLVVTMHSARVGSFVNFDGPSLDAALLWSEHSGMPVVPSDEMAEPTPGSFGTWAGRTLGVPVLTIELRKGMRVQEALELAGEASVVVVRSAVRASEPVAWPPDPPACVAQEG